MSWGCFLTGHPNRPTIPNKSTIHGSVCPVGDATHNCHGLVAKRGGILPFGPSAQPPRSRLHLCPMCRSSAAARCRRIDTQSRRPPHRRPVSTLPSGLYLAPTCPPRRQLGAEEGSISCAATIAVADSAESRRSSPRRRVLTFFGPTCASVIGRRERYGYPV